MKLENLLRERKDAVLKKWFRHVVKTYPDETARFLQQEKDPFDNPVGSNVIKGIEEVFEQLTSEKEITTINPFLERMVKIRAIQDFRPSEAVAFVFALKDIIEVELSDASGEKEDHHELIAFNRRIDALALLVFDVYMKSREKVYKLKVNEVKNRVSGLLKRANLLADLEDNAGDEEMHH
jgi:hypothetical protein